MPSVSWAAKAAADLDEIVAILESGRTGLKTGWKRLDYALSGLQPGFHVIAGEANIGKCVTGDTEVVDPTTGRIRTIKELCESKQGKVLTLTDDLKLIATEPKVFMNNGVKPVFRLTTRLGKTITATANHPFLTLLGWKKLEDLKVGERIAVPRRIPVCSSRKLSEYEVKLIAYLLSDGSTRKVVEFTNTDQKILRDFEEAVKAFDPDLCMKQRKSSPATYYVGYRRGYGRSKNSRLRDYLRALGIWNKSACEKAIPEVIFELTNEQVALFLNRLYACDGCATVTAKHGPATIEYSTVSEKMARQIQHLLLRLGIVSMIRKRTVKYNGSHRTAWSIDIRDKENLLKFAEKIGIFGKEEALQKVIETASQRKRNAGQTKDTIPGAIWQYIKEQRYAKGIAWKELGSALGSSAPKGLVRTDAARGCNVSRDKVKAIGMALNDQWLIKLGSSDIYWDIIVSIEYAGEQEVYDLTIPLTHNFVANDIIIHNSLFISQLSWQVAMYNEHVHVMDITLDDSKLDKVCRLVAHLSGIPINHVKRMGIYKQKDPKTYAMIQSAFKTLKSNIERYHILDAGEAGVLEQLRATIMETRAELMAREDPWQLVVFIDSFHDIVPAELETASETAKFNYLAQATSDLAKELDIPIVCTAELRKLNSMRRPTLDDIRESVKIRYEAKSVLLCYNDVGARGEQADLYWYPQDDIAKYPVFEVHIAKNKCHSFKGRLCFEFKPDVAFFREPDDATHRKYLDIINAKNR